MYQTVLIKCTLQCNNCAELQKPYKQQPVVEEKRARMGPQSQTLPVKTPFQPTKDSQIFWFPLHVSTSRRGFFPFDAFHSAKLYTLTSDLYKL